MIKQLIKDVAIYGVASSIGKFIGLFLLPIYTRVFSPEEYGVIDLISSVVVLFSILGMAQLESSISRYYYTAKEEQERRLYVSTAFWAIIGLSVFWSLSLVGVSGHISLLLFKTIQYKKIIIVSAMIIPASNLYSYLTTVMRYLKKPLMYSVFVIVQMLASVGLSIWLVVYEGLGIIGVFYGQLFGFIIGTVVQLFYLRFLLSFSFQMNMLWNFFRYGLPMVPAVAGGWVNSYVNRFVMVGYLTLADIGVYTVALKIASVFQLIESAFRMAWGPFMWENFEKENHRNIYRYIMKFVSICVFFTIGVFALFSKELLMLLTTPNYIEAGSLTGMIAFSIGLTIISQTIGLGPGIIKRTELNTLIYFFSVGANMACLLIMVPKIGLIAVPLSLLIGTTATVLLGWYNSERLYYIGFSKAFFFIAYMVTALSVGISLRTETSIIVKMSAIFFTIAIYSIMIFMGKKPLFSWKYVLRGLKNG